MRKVLFIDRDGTLIIEPQSDKQVDSFSKLTFYPEVFQWLSRISVELDYDLVMVTNQDGLGTSSFPEKDFWPVQNFVIDAFKNEGIVFTDILIDKSFEHEKKDTRKPRTGMLQKYIYGDYDMPNSFVIGDRNSDMQLAKNLKANGIFIGSENQIASLCTDNWKEVYLYLKSKPRKATITRKTNESSISVTLNLDGVGNSDISTGLPFFDHMLEQVARHGGIDLFIDVKGDLKVDEHHTIEDTAIALGQAFSKALGSKKGIQRYGFLLPMDDCLAQVAIDFGGRPYLIWDAEFKREKIGDMPTEMFSHFFKSFCDAAQCNLNIEANGDNEHHLIESIFKAFAKSIQSAVALNNTYLIPSTKGVL